MNRNTGITDFQRSIAKDSRLCIELRQSITQRVGGRYLPRALSKQTKINILKATTENPDVEKITKHINHIKIRMWISESCDIPYNPSEESRGYTFRKRELQQIDFMLKSLGIEPNNEIETDNPKLCEHREGK